MYKNNIIKRLLTIVNKDNLFLDEPMKNHTSFKVGGTADIFITPQNEMQIRDIIRLCKENDYELYVIGNGTNLIVKDGGVRGVVVQIFDKYNNITVEDNTITAQAGALLSTTSRIALKNDLKGLEFACGIPGTIGGAVAMNAGAYNGEIKDTIYSIDVIDEEFNIINLPKDKLKMGYRTSIVSENKYVVLKSSFMLQKGNHDDIKNRMECLNQRRREKQPLNYPSAGSTFKRPEGYFAAKLIEDAGLKGIRVGGAQVSAMHSGFIINENNATANDILKLIDLVKNEVYKKFGVSLEPEVKIIGEN